MMLQISEMTRQGVTYPFRPCLDMFMSLPMDDVSVGLTISLIFHFSSQLVGFPEAGSDLLLLAVDSTHRDREEENTYLSSGKSLFCFFKLVNYAE